VRAWGTAWRRARRREVPRASGKFVAHCDDQAAAAELEVEQGLERAARLAHQIPAGHTEVGRAVGDELGDVLGAYEECFELAAERGGERALSARAHLETGVAEQIAGLLGKAALVGECDAEHGVLGMRAKKNAAARPGRDGPR
jgi:hypothetical protein